MEKRRMINFIVIPLIFIGLWLGMKWYKAPNFGQGDTAVNFTAYMPNGDSIQLADFEGKIVLLDFWGSWCGPCRKKNKELVRIYDKYKDAKWKNAKGFEIISVGIETRKNNWLGAIQQDQLNWKYHVSDLSRFEDHVAKLYGVVEIPAVFVINENNRIVGVNLDDKALERLLERKRLKD
ncbi:MAG: TlpA family protein disulfide reductase [Saprospiraceae bacterium]|nr:TlpA family protein disulfide reductase [Saprospiraceae bacterium]